MLPKILKPTLARRTDAAFYSDEHVFEIKWDGIRCLAAKGISLCGKPTLTVP